MKLETKIINTLKEYGKKNVSKPVDIKVIPEGDYNLSIEKILAGEATNGNGYRIIVNFQVIDGEYQGFEFPTTFCLKHPDKNVEKLSNSLFYDMLLSAGIKEWQINNFDTDLLLSKKVRAHVIVEPAKGDYPERNRAFNFVI